MQVKPFIPFTSTPMSLRFGTDNTSNQSSISDETKEILADLASIYKQTPERVETIYRAFTQRDDLKGKGEEALLEAVMRALGELHQKGPNASKPTTEALGEVGGY